MPSASQRPRSPARHRGELAQGRGHEKAREETWKLLALCAIAPVNRPVQEAALELDFADFEDGVLYEAARQVDAEAIVTRNPRDFKKAKLPIVTPEEFTKISEQREREARHAQGGEADG